MENYCERWQNTVKYEIKYYWDKIDVYLCVCFRHMLSASSRQLTDKQNLYGKRSLLYCVYSVNLFPHLVLLNRIYWIYQLHCTVFTHSQNHVAKKTNSKYVLSFLKFYVYSSFVILYAYKFSVSNYFPNRFVNWFKWYYEMCVFLKNAISCGQFTRKIAFV